MSLATRQSHSVAALLRVHGCDVTRASGETIRGVFIPVGASATAPYSQVGLNVRIDRQANPFVYVEADEAEDLVKGDTLTIGDTSYLITAPPQATGVGLSRIELMPDPGEASEGKKYQ